MMARLTEEDKAQRYKRVLEAVEDHLLETGRFCALADIAERTNLSESICRGIANQLVRQEQLYVAHESVGSPTIYAPAYAMRNILRAQPKPKWLSDYQFSERGRAEKAMVKARQNLEEFDHFEALLYATGPLLEEAVLFSLKSFHYEDVQYKPNGDNRVDMTFWFEGKKFVCEVTGKGGPGDKDDILQVDGWKREEVDKAQVEPNNLVGVLVINHYRHDRLPDRPKPLTDEGYKYAQLYQVRVVSTPYVFDIVRRIRYEGLDREEARRLILEGEDCDRSEKGKQ